MRGHRHTALFALAVVAVKCRVPEDVLKADAARVVQAFNHRDPQGPCAGPRHRPRLGSVDAQEAKNVRSEAIERWVGWTFERRTKRNGRSRQEHLTEVAHVASAAARSGRARRCCGCVPDQPPRRHDYGHYDCHEAGPGRQSRSMRGSGGSTAKPPLAVHAPSHMTATRCLQRL